MKSIVHSALVVAALMVSSLAKATPLDDKMAALRNAMVAEMAARQAKADATHTVNGFPGKMYEAQLGPLSYEMGANPGDERTQEMTISTIFSAYSSEAVQKAGEDLITELHRERNEREEAAKPNVDSMMKRVASEVLKATKPEDLDDLIVDLEKSKDLWGFYTTTDQLSFQRVAAALDFVKLWQDYLQHKISGQIQQASLDLQNMLANNSGSGIFPRSQILKLEDEAKHEAAIKDQVPAPTDGGAAEAIVNSVKALEDMEPALQKLALLRQNDVLAQTAYNNLAPLLQLYTNVKAGLPASLNLNFGSNNDELDVGPELQVQLLLFVLQHYFDSYQGTPPTPDEKPDVFVDRVIANAVSREDWSLLQKALAAQVYLNRNSLFGASPDASLSTGVDDLLEGLNQEAAGQYVLAVVSYQNALKVPDALILAKMIGDKLAAIQKNHPKEYEDGMQIVISPPVPRYNPSMMQDRFYRPGMPGSSSYPRTQPSPSLSIPGLSPKQTPSPALPSTSTTIIIPAQSIFPTNRPPVMPQFQSTNAPSAK